MSRPKFISWTGHGAAASAPPASFSGARAFVFAFDGKHEAIQGLVNSLLQPAALGQFEYRVPSSSVFVTFMAIDRCEPKEEVVGWTPGRECAIWIPLWEHPSAGGPGRLVLWAPYVFINYSLGLITGREVWGWPKVGGVIGMPADRPHAPAAFTCQTMIFRSFGRNVRATEEPLITVRAPGPPRRPTTGWDKIIHGLESIAEHISEDVLGVARKAHLLDQHILPAIALKQFRDSASPGLACYQAIVNSPCRLTNFHKGGLLTDTYELEFACCSSHPILTDLSGETMKSRGSTKRPVKWAAWLHFDFEAGPGSVVTH
jgi:hypothetical protein